MALRVMGSEAKDGLCFACAVNISRVIVQLAG